MGKINPPEQFRGVYCACILVGSRRFEPRDVFRVVKLCPFALSLSATVLIVLILVCGDAQTSGTTAPQPVVTGQHSKASVQATGSTAVPPVVQTGGAEDPTPSGTQSNDNAKTAQIYFVDNIDLGTATRIVYGGLPAKPVRTSAALAINMAASV